MAQAPQDQIAPLLTPEGWELLASLGPYQEEKSFELNSALRKAGHSPELVSAVLTQSRLRTRAAAKFGEFARSMLFTQAGLEQATRLNVAARHAQRFAEAGISHVADLGCGLAADSLALASMDINVTAVEMDETTAACATVNLIPFPNATVVHADATAVPLDGVDGVWLDPARRVTSTSGTKRIWDPEAFSPPLSFVEDLAASGLAVGVKMGPGMPHDSVPASCEAQWVSVAGDVTEVALWFNAVRRPGVRRAALVLGAQGAAELTSGEEFGAGPTAPVGPVEGYLYEPDGAVIRAGLVADVALQLGGHLVDEHIAYVCAPELVDTPFARAYKVLEVMPYNVKALKAWVKDNGIGVLDIKKRGTAVTPEELRKQLLPSGKNTGGKNAAGKKAGTKTATLVLTRIGEDRVAIVVEPAQGTAREETATGPA
ncbi:THUMP-like domain-containing protein [Pseudarthrobacter sp. NKDBFgelt]|uniref:THUMP-like domain-containing protein n=1 Tax=Pseudarthrobacter sp. NKDBFgelt TaxID=3384443 RepID=UPI0038D41BC0